MVHIEAKHLTNRFEKSYHDVQVSKRCLSTTVEEASHVF
jgi:hypothetical protein